MYPNLRAEIARAGMTKKEFGELIGMSPSETSRVLHGKRAITLSLAGDIKKALGTNLPLEELFAVEK